MLLPLNRSEYYFYIPSPPLTPSAVTAVRRFTFLLLFVISPVDLMPLTMISRIPAVIPLLTLSYHCSALAPHSAVHSISATDLSPGASPLPHSFCPASSQPFSLFGTLTLPHSRFAHSYDVISSLLPPCLVRHSSRACSPSRSRSRPRVETTPTVHFECTLGTHSLSGPVRALIDRETAANA